MTLLQTLGVAMNKTRRGGKARRTAPSARPRLEALEHRAVPATLTRPPFVGHITYDATPGVANSLRISYDGVRYIFADVEPITASGLIDLDPDPRRVVFFASAADTLTVNLGDGNDHLSVEAVVDPLTVNAGAGNDRIEVGTYYTGPGTYPPVTLDGIRAPVTVRGDAGYDELWVNDWAEGDVHTYTITNTRVIRSPAVIDYTGTVELVRLNEGYAGNTVNVAATSPA
jgi:hypothetical protein